MPLKVSRALAESLERPVVLQASIESAVKVLDLDMGVIYLLKGDDLYLHATTPRPPAGPSDQHRHTALSDHPHLERCIREFRPAIVEDVAKEEMSERGRLARRGQRQVVQADRAQEHRAGCRLRRGLCGWPRTLELRDNDTSDQAPSYRLGWGHIGRF